MFDRLFVTVLTAVVADTVRELTSGPAMPHSGVAAVTMFDRPVCNAKVVHDGIVPEPITVGRSSRPAPNTERAPVAGMFTETAEDGTYVPGTCVVVAPLLA